MRAWEQKSYPHFSLIDSESTLLINVMAMLGHLVWVNCSGCNTVNILIHIKTPVQHVTVIGFSFLCCSFRALLQFNIIIVIVVNFGPLTTVQISRMATTKMKVHALEKKDNCTAF